MKSAGMKLTKWLSNSPIVDSGSEGTKRVLGITWDPNTDSFQFTGVKLPDIEYIRYSKRVVLSLIARVFDPLGLVLPFVVKARFLFQDIWRLGVEWDEDLPEECQNSFRQ